MASVDGEPRFVLHPVTAEDLEAFGDRKPIVVVPSRPIADIGGSKPAEGTGPTIALRLNGKFDGSLTVIVNCPPAGSSKGSGGGGGGGGVNQVWANQNMALTGPLALDQFGESSATYVGASGSSSNGCGGLLVLAVIVLLMMLAAGGSLASFTSRPGATYSGLVGAPAIAQASIAPAPFLVQGSAATGAQPITDVQGAYCLPCASQVAAGIGRTQTSAPANAAAPAWATPVQVNACTRNPSCPGACPVAPFCANQLAVKGVCNPATGLHFYYFPGQAGYVETQVGLYAGDAYFCNFSEAVAAGFMLAP